MYTKIYRVGNVLFLPKIAKLTELDTIFPSLYYLLTFPLIKIYWDFFLHLFIINVDLKFTQQIFIRDTCMRQVESMGVENTKVNGNMPVIGQLKSGSKHLSLTLNFDLFLFV